MAQIFHLFLIKSQGNTNDNTLSSFINMTTDLARLSVPLKLQPLWDGLGIPN